MRPEDFDADSSFIDSDFFANLPTEVKYEIIGDLRIKSRQVNHRRVDEMRILKTAHDFSRAQIKNLMQRNTLTQKLFSVTDAMGQSSIAIPTRVAGERNREYLLVKQDADKGGGWVLGVRNPKLHNVEPITIDTTSDESSNGQGTDSDDFEEVGIPKATCVLLAFVRFFAVLTVFLSNRRGRSPSLDPEVRRTLAMEAIRARYAPDVAPTLDPYLDQPTLQRRKSLFQSERNARVELEEEMDPELQEALMESAAMAGASMEMEESTEMDDAFAESALLAQLAHAVGDFDAGLSGANQSNAVASGSGSKARAAAVDDGGESDSSLEYVDIPSRPASPKHSLPTVTLHQHESDDSDAFEEIDLVAVNRLASAALERLPFAGRPPFPSPSAAPVSIPSPPPLRRPSPTPSTPNLPPLPASDSLPPSLDSSSLPIHHSPPTEAAPYRTSLMDTLLPSDSESDSDFAVVEPAPIPPPSHPLAPRPQPPTPASVSNPESTRLPPASLRSTADLRRDPVENDVDFGGDESKYLPVFTVRNAARSLALSVSNSARNDTPRPEPSTSESPVENLERLRSPERSPSPEPLPQIGRASCRERVS